MYVWMSCRTDFNGDADMTSPNLSRLPYFFSARKLIWCQIGDDDTWWWWWWFIWWFEGLLFVTSLRRHHCLIMTQGETHFTFELFSLFFYFFVWSYTCIPSDELNCFVKNAELHIYLPSPFYGFALSWFVSRFLRASVSGPTTYFKPIDICIHISNYICVYVYTYTRRTHMKVQEPITWEEEQELDIKGWRDERWEMGCVEWEMGDGRWKERMENWR